jgi:hypothetical protein
VRWGRPEPAVTNSDHTVTPPRQAKPHAGVALNKTLYALWTLIIQPVRFAFHTNV